MHKPKLLIVTTIPLSLNFYRGQIGVLKKAFDVEVVSSSGDHLASVCADEAVKGHAVDMKRNISLLSDVRSLLKMLRLFAQARPRMVLGSTPKAGLISMCAAWMAGVRTRVYYLHGLRYDGVSGKKRALLMNMERLSCRFATHVFSVSKGVSERLVSDNITTKPIRMIHNGSVNGINADYFNPNIEVNPINLPKDFEEGFVFGFVGRLVRDKGINELVSAFKLLQSQHPRARLLLVGNFEDLDPVDAETRRMIEEDSTIYNAGFQSDIRPWLLKMDLYVFPSYREGFGMSLMEALAMGIPAISSNITGCNEIIQNGENGLLFKSRDRDALFKAMQGVLSNEALYKQIKCNARELVIKKYDQKAVWEHTLTAYTDLIHDRTT